MATINYPSWVDTDEKKLKCLILYGELNERLCNAMGRWFKDGLTQVQYDKLPNRVKLEYPYETKLASTRWRDYEYNWDHGFDRVHIKIHKARQAIEQSFKDDDTINISIEDID